MEWWAILLIVLGSISIFIGLSVMFYKPFFKRFYDILFSSLAILVLLPFFILFTPIVAISMKGNPFFVQARPGKKEKIFNLIKYRSMNNKKDKDGKLLPDSERLTKFGRIIRKTSIDELPELFNIFIGDMSIIGPRPLAVKYLPYYNDEEKHRHDIRPGLSGLAQINGRNALDWEQRFSYDLKYEKNISLFMDIKIIFKTVLKVLKKDNIVIRGEGQTMDFDVYRIKQRKNLEEAKQ